MQIRTRSEHGPKLALGGLLLTLPAFFLVLSGPAPVWFVRELHPLAHVVWFGVLGWSLRDLPGMRDLSGRRRVIGATGIVIALTALIELLQTFTGRAAELADAMLNLVGATLGYTLRSGAASRWVPAAVLTLLATSEPIAGLLDRAIAWQTHPRLGDFEQPLEAGRWRLGERTDALAFEGRHSLRLELCGGRWPGTARMRSFGAWEDYDELVFAVHASHPVPLNVSIGDAEHQSRGSPYGDRYDGRFDLSEGWNRIVVPLESVRRPPSGRIQQLDRLKRFVLFVRREDAPVVLHLDAMHLR